MHRIARIATGGLVGGVVVAVVGFVVGLGLWYYGHFAPEFFYPITSASIIVIGCGGGGVLGNKNPLNCLQEELPVSPQEERLLTNSSLTSRNLPINPNLIELITITTGNDNAPVASSSMTSVKALHPQFTGSSQNVPYTSAELNNSLSPPGGTSNSDGACPLIR